MNNQIITLSSNSSDWVKKNTELLFDDYTTLSIQFNGIDETYVPLYLTIDWGDGLIESFDNNIIQSNLNNINNFNFNPVFTTTYTHDYTPSNTSLYKSLSAQVLIKYSNLDESWFILPIKIRTYDYFESIYDLKLINCNILPTEDNSKQFQFIAEKGNYLVELRES